MSIKVLELQNSIKNKVLPLYIISGEDYYFRKYALNTLLELAGEGMSVFNIAYFGSSDSVDDVLMAVNIPPMMSDYKLVVWTGDIKKPLSDQQKKMDKAIADYVKLPAPNSVLVLVDEGEYFKSVAKYGEVVDCKHLETSLLSKYVNEYIEKKGLTMEPFLIKELVERCSNDMAHIAGEIDKLIAYSDGTDIDLDILNSVVTNSVEQAIYALTDAIVKNNVDEAYTLLDKLLARGEQPLQLLGLITGQFKRMFFTKISKESDDEIAKKLGTSSYPIKLARGFARKYKPMELNNIVERLHNIEYDAKSGRIGIEEGLRLAMAMVTKRR